MVLVPTPSNNQIIIIIKYTNGKLTNRTSIKFT
jgi:hypothetical protein